MATTYAIPNGRTVFNAITYTGTGSNTAISNADVGSTGFKPDFVWIKSRSNTTQHSLYDAIRGIGNILQTNSTSAASQDSAGYSLTSFNSNGFNVGIENASVGSTNYSGYNYIAWQWQAGAGTTLTNTNGSITSTISVNQTAGFSIVTYTGTGSAGTVGHGLSATPSMIFFKRRSASDDWYVYHTSVGAGSYMSLNQAAASTVNSSLFNNTSPNTSVFSVGSSTSASGQTNVAYCWAPVAGFSQFGSYTGNGTSDGPFVYLGFRPRFIMIKRTDASGNDWRILDTARDPYNYTQHFLYPDLTQAEDSGYTYDIVSNGFKIRTSNNGDNIVNGTFIYAAFAENPFKYSNAR